jgi:hypothetical protein
MAIVHFGPGELRSRAMVKLRSLANLVTEWKDKRYTSAISGNYVSPLSDWNEKQ